MAKLPANVTRIIIGAVVLAIVAVGAYFVFFNGSSSKKVTAQFASAIGIYTGTPVRILGVNVGEVTGVHPGGAYVTVDMQYDSKYKLAPNASAIEVANSLVSDRYIQLTPLWDAKRDGPKYLSDDAVIDVEHTGGPAELDDIYASLDKLAVALGPQGANKGGQQSGALSELLKVAAANLQGNGAAFGRSITKLSGAAQTLANSRGDLFGTVRNLQQFAEALHASDGQIRLFNQQLAQVATDLASERGDLGAALHDLGLALDDVSRFVKQNAAKFHTDIQGLEEITGVLVKEKSSLNETLAIGPVALANLVHTYQPDIGAIATRGNLASFSSTQNNSATNILCSILGLAPIDLSKVCPTNGGGGGGLPGLPGLGGNAGTGIPGLIGAGG
ncbi:MAG: phospholipid/cholesterol/gamma-HCH transport system substrate-binding protein [Pseudonocardiales bacterium]|jgi:phospholipid/cholesterol/gamma-HCH transport system substrate-binding protein|nr:phospholipid/cholesterol/gamma-HCH transport system substrate-binding protein [Pseudonocardiales bacterium]